MDKKWRQLCGIPQGMLREDYLRYSNNAPNILDELEEVIGPPSGKDRFEAMSWWLATTPLTDKELCVVRTYIAQQIA